jgi:hypothetical protein
MKAVVYHADSHFAWGGDVGDLYQRLFVKFRQRCRDYGFEKVIHLTLEGFPAWGDETMFYSGYDPKDVMFNRELIFADFISKAPDDVYWFGEPDYVFFKQWPELTTDIALLYRSGDSVPMTPGWRLARPKAATLFSELAEKTKNVPIGNGVGMDWHCDSAAFNSVWKDMGKPMLGKFEYKGMIVEMREYREYVKPGVYSRNYNGPSKKKLLDL